MNILITLFARFTFAALRGARGVLGSGLIAALAVAGATRALETTARAAAGESSGAGAAEQFALQRTQKKLAGIIIPRLEFREATVQDALNFLRTKSVELDTAEPDPAKRGVKIILNLAAPLAPGAGPVPLADEPAKALITVALTNIPLIEALRYVTGLANLKFRVEPDAVRVVPQNAALPEAKPRAAEPEAAEPAVNRRKRIQQKLDTIVIPQLELREATIREAVDFLRKKSAESDAAEPDADRRGVNLILRLDEMPAPALEPRVSVSLRNVPLVEALKRVTGPVRMKFRVEDFAVAIVRDDGPNGVLVTKEFKVSAGAIQSLALGSGRQAKASLTAKGVNFPPGSSAIWLPAPKRLLMRNTQENFDALELLLDANP